MSDELYLNNTCIAVLPALLNKTKVRTTRKAYKKCFVTTPNNIKVTNQYEKDGYIYADIEGNGELTTKPKPAQFKPGDIVNMYWNKESVYESFCKTCGNPLIDNKFWDNCTCDEEGMIPFNKFLGRFRITEVEKIKIVRQEEVLFITKNNEYISDIEELVFVKEEGFSSVNEMFRFFDEWLDLSEPRELWTYKGEWI